MIGEDLGQAAKVASRKEQLLERLPEDMAVAIAPITDKLGDGYWLSFSMAKMLMHARFFDTLLKAGHDPEMDTATKIRVNPRRNVTELWVLTRNRPGLFSKYVLSPRPRWRSL